MKVTYIKPVQTGCARNEQGELTAPDFDIMLKGPIQFTGPIIRTFPTNSNPPAHRTLPQNLLIGNFTRPYSPVRAVGRKRKRQDKIGIGRRRRRRAHPIKPDNNHARFNGAPWTSARPHNVPKTRDLNHTFLSVNAIRQRAVALAGVVMNNYCNAPKISFLKTTWKPFVTQSARAVSGGSL